MPNYPAGTTPEQLQAERAEEARRVTQGYEIRELRAFPDCALRKYELENATLRKHLEAAYHALRSYQHGNSAPELAKEVADSIGSAIKEEAS